MTSLTVIATAGLFVAHAVSDVVEMLPRNKSTSMIRESIAVLDKMKQHQKTDKQNEIDSPSSVQDTDTTSHQLKQDNDSTSDHPVFEKSIADYRRESKVYLTQKNAIVRRKSYEDLDKILLEWYKLAREKNLAVNTQMLREQSVMYARQLGHGSFSGSKIWLDRWMSQHNIKLSSLTSKDPELDLTVVSDWRQRLVSICQGYDLSNVFVADETGLLYTALPNQSMTIKSEEARSESDRISVLLACSATGEKLMPFIIGRSENPPCFRGGMPCLPVTYVSNKKASVTGRLFQKWLNKVNILMKREHRSILMLVTNPAAYTDVVRSHIKLVFLPVKCQPHDSEIIQTMKMYYRKQLLQRVLFYMDEESFCTMDITKKVNLLDVIMWLKTAWDSVQPSTIRKHFVECGFIQANAKEDSIQLNAKKDSGMAELSETDENNLSLEPDLKLLIHTAGTTWIEYANCDQDLPTTYTDDKEEKNDPNTGSEDEVDDNDSYSELSGKIAASYLHELRDYAVANNNLELLELSFKSQGIVEKIMTQKAPPTQTRIAKFFVVGSQ